MSSHQRQEFETEPNGAGRGIEPGSRNRQMRVLPHPGPPAEENVAGCSGSPTGPRPPFLEEGHLQTRVSLLDSSSRGNRKPDSLLRNPGGRYLLSSGKLTKAGLQAGPGPKAALLGEGVSSPSDAPAVGPLSCPGPGRAGGSGSGPPQPLAAPPHHAPPGPASCCPIPPSLLSLLLTAAPASPAPSARRRAWLPLGTSPGARPQPGRPPPRARWSPTHPLPP